MRSILVFASLFLAFVAGAFTMLMAVVVPENTSIWGNIKEVISAAIGSGIALAGAVWIADITNRRNSENARRQTEAVLLRGDLEDLRKEINSLRGHFVATMAHKNRLERAIHEFTTKADNASRYNVVREIERVLCTPHLPRELNIYDVEDERLGFTIAMNVKVNQLHALQQEMVMAVKAALMGGINLEKLEVAIGRVGALRVGCESLAADIHKQMTVQIEHEQTVREEYLKLRQWHHD